MNSIINRLERFNNVIVGLGSNLIGNMILFLTTMYITNNVTEDVYGQFRLVFAFVSILVIALMMGRDSSILYFYQKEKNDKVILEESFSGIILVVIGCGLLYIFDVFFIKYVLSNKVSVENYHLSLLMLPLWAAYNLLTPVVRVKGFINSSFILSNLLQRFLRFPFLFLFIYAGYNNFRGLAWSMILSQGILLVILVMYLMRTLTWHSPQMTSFFTRFGYSFSLGMNAIMLSVAGKIDVLLLGKLSTTSDVAIYDIVTSLAIVTLFPYIALTKSFEPKLYGYFDNAKIQLPYRNNISLSFTLSVFAGLFFILFGHEILSVFGNAYARGTVALMLLAAIYTAVSCWGAVSEWMTMNGYAKYNFIILMSCGVINISLCYILIPLWGLIGATIALGISLISSKLAAFVFIQAKHSAIKLVANIQQIIIFIITTAAAGYYSDSNFTLKVIVYILLMVAICISQKTIRIKISGILNRGVK
ncbi:lipopolysaccharide biosynthesis protein [Pantoea sp. FN060301]|uniref:lipopolysaccharide biosynthesis protein n=1 Tax=Pantoea sp. FN060301 TaxID=3420380 RepID=UPI003D173623